METCPVCGEKAVKEDTENGQKVRVCIECGAMDSDMQELTSEDQFQGTTITDGRGRGPEGRKSWLKDSSSNIQKNKMLGTKLITGIGNQLNVGENIIAEACHLYERVYEDELHYARQDNKKAMCLACLYASARINKVSVNIRVLGFFLNIKDSAKRFGSALKILKKRHAVHLPAISIENETWGLLSQSGLSNEVVKTTQQLMLIMQRALVTTGRAYLTTMVPCSYFAFKASDMFKNRKLCLKAFCRKFGFKLDLKYRCRGEIENTLKAMAKELPWVKGSGVDTNHVEIYIKDIIKYQSSLFAQAIQAEVNQMDEVDDYKNEVGIDRNKETSIFRKFPKRELEDESNVKEGDEGKKKKVKLEKREKTSECVSAGNSSGLESLDLGSDDDTDLYILPLHEVMLKREVEKKCGLHVEEEKSEDSDLQVTDSKEPFLTNGEGLKLEYVNDTGYGGDDTDDEEDCNDDEKLDEEVDEMEKNLLKRQSDGTANDSTYSDEDYD